MRAKEGYVSFVALYAMIFALELGRRARKLDLRATILHEGESVLQIVDARARRAKESESA